MNLDFCCQSKVIPVHNLVYLVTGHFPLGLYKYVSNYKDLYADLISQGQKSKSTILS